MIYKKGSFTVIPNKEKLCGCPAEMQSIYFWICEHADNDGICFPTRKTIASEAGVNIKTLDKYLVLLVENCFLSKEVRKVSGKKHNTSNLYQILIIDSEVAPKTVLPSTENGATPSTENGAETIPIINSNNLTMENSDETSQQIVFLIDAFKEINPVYRKWFANTTQRSAAKRIIESHTLEKTLAVIKILPVTNQKKFLPSIMTPLQLEDKWSQLEMGLKRMKQEKLETKIAFY